MESIEERNNVLLKNEVLANDTEREVVLKTWLHTTCGFTSFSLQPLIGDASFRRYFRVRTPSDSFIVMDAPPSKENCRPYVAIANALRDIGLTTPTIFAADVSEGFLLISDFGDITYLQAVEQGDASTLYPLALQALARLQQCSQVENHPIPPFTRDFMWKEWAWHKEWFLDKFLGLSTIAVEKELDHCYELIVESAATQPQVFMHRDYHSANLMVLPNGALGILDFQDAFIGPLTYDLASLLRDCYIDWPADLVRVWVGLYFQLLCDQSVLREGDEQTFFRWFDWMSVQRHLKALLTFARKHVRDHQSKYLAHIPRTLTYLCETTKHYPELQSLHEFLTKTVQPTFMHVMASQCEA